MILSLFLQAALGAIGTQALPKSGCAAYLWSRTEPPALVAMVTAPGTLRVALDGRTLDLPRTAAVGGARGLPATSRYAAGDVSATLDMSIVERPDLTDGAVVPQALLMVERPGADAIIAPVAGMIGCAPAR